MTGNEKKLAGIYNAWVQQDKDKFRALMCEAFQKGLDKNSILQFLQENKRAETAIDEDFEEWAYKFIVTEGASDCPLG